MIRGGCFGPASPDCRRSARPKPARAQLARSALRAATGSDMVRASSGFGRAERRSHTPRITRPHPSPYGVRAFNVWLKPARPGGVVVVRGGRCVPARSLASRGFPIRSQPMQRLGLAGCVGALWGCLQAPIAGGRAGARTTRPIRAARGHGLRHGARLFRPGPRRSAEVRRSRTAALAPGRNRSTPPRQVVASADCGRATPSCGIAMLSSSRLSPPPHQGALVSASRRRPLLRRGSGAVG